MLAVVNRIGSRRSFRGDAASKMLSRLDGYAGDSAMSNVNPYSLLEVEKWEPRDLLIFLVIDSVWITEVRGFNGNIL